MNTELSQLTLEKLAAFAARRRFLIALRGLCVGVIALLVVMSMIAVADALFVIKSQALRWALTLTGYAIVAISIWVTCLRSILRIPGPRELARLIEQAAPGLREDLISAVELGSPQSDARYDSPIFRALLQASVERRMSGVRIAALLPGGLIRGAALGATGVLICCVALLLVPDLKYANRLTRALLPSAPVDRVSNVQVRIIAPNPADSIAPHNDAVSIIVELTGSEAEEVVLETFRNEDETEDESLLLKPSGGTRRFAGVIQLGREDVRYRVLAGDAVTRTYTIRTGARPHAMAFRKTYQFPIYADMKAIEVAESHGHLEAVEGTNVELVIDTDQPVRSGELRFEEPVGAKEKLEPVALARITERQWQAVLPITQSTLYKVHLVADATGFNNEFDPPYEIKATPDLAPVLSVESPAKDRVVAPGEAVGVKLSASDDLGLLSVSQLVRINGGEWNTVVLADKPGRQWTRDQPWDLYDLNLRSGDQLTTRFAATDHAGHTTQSAPVSITIAAGGLRDDRLAGIEAKRSLLSTLASLTKSAKAAGKIADEADAPLARGGELERRQLLQTLALALQKVKDDAEASHVAVLEAIKANPSGGSAAELVRLGMGIATVRDRIAVPALTEADRAASGKGALSRWPLDITKHAPGRCEAMEASLRRSLSSDEADAVLRDLIALSREQAALDAAHAVDEAGAWQRLARRQLIVVSQLKAVETLADVLATREVGHEAALKAAIKSLAAARTEAQRVLATPSKTVVLAQHEQINRVLRETKTLLLPVARAMSMKARPFEESGEVGARQIAAALRDLLSASPSLDSAHHWVAVHQWLKSVTKQLETMPEAEPMLVADLGLLRRAASAIEERLKTEPATAVRARIERVADAFDVLEAGQGAASSRTLAAQLASDERWQRDDGVAVTRHEREWSWLAADLATQVERFNTLPFAGDAKSAAAQLPRSGAVAVLETEMLARRMKGVVAQRRATQLEQLKQQLDEIKKLIAPDMAKARAIIAAEAPTLPQMLAAAAKEARKLGEKAAEASEKPAPDAARSVAKEQEALAAKLREITEALRHDANAQDVMSPTGRERARDADDAAAMIREPASKAEDAARQAQEAATEQGRGQKLAEAAAQDDRLAKSLEKVAEHYENLAKGYEEATRSALRDAERDLGLKRELDAQYGRMERLAGLASKPAEEQRAELERELKQNEAMQAELSDIAKGAVESAKAALENAAERQERVADNLAAAQRLAKEAKPDVAEQMRDLSSKADSLAGKTPSIAQAAKKGTAVDAAQSAAEAGAALKGAAEMKPPVNAQDEKAAAAQSQQLAEALRKASEKLKAAEKQASAAADRVRQEESDATAKLAVGNATNEERLKAADTMLHAKPRQDANRRAAAEAKAASAKAAELAAQAEKLAAESTKATDAGSDAIEDGLREQPAIADALRGAADEVDRAARHEQRLENKQGADSLARAKEGIAQDGAPQVRRAADRLAAAKKPEDAKQAVEHAEEAIERQATKLEQMLRDDRARGKAGDRATGDRGQPADEASNDAAKWMARALDQLDQQNARPMKGEPPPLSPEAMQRLAQAEKNAAARADQGQPTAQNSDPSGKPGTPGNGKGSSGDKPSPEGSPSAAAQNQPNGSSPRQPSDAAHASQAIREAAEAQRSAMSQARQEGGPMAAGGTASRRERGKPNPATKGQGGDTPGGQGDSQQTASGENQSGQGQGQSATGNRGNAAETGELPNAEHGRRGEWGQLPPRLARELMEGQRDEVPAEYRSQVEAYFRAIAQKAKAQQP